MAVFLMNICKFNGCGIIFRTLGDLIQHIEDTHIDFDPRVLEKQELQQPPCIPLSYVLRVFTEATKKENLEYYKKQKRAQSPAVSICSTTPSGSEFDEEELVSASDDSNDSWTTQEEFSSEFILRYGGRNGVNSTQNEEKPFACPVPGCKKRYKNINGIKYHAKNGHRKDARVKKPFRCHCGKSYKTTKGLRSHSLSYHGGLGGGFPPAVVLADEPLTSGIRGGSVSTTSPYDSNAVITATTTNNQTDLISAHCAHHTAPPPPPAHSNNNSSSSTASNSCLPLAMLLATPPPTPTSAQATTTCTSAPTYSRSTPHGAQQLVASSSSNGGSPPLSCCTGQHHHHHHHHHTQPTTPVSSHGFAAHSYSPLNLYPPFTPTSPDTLRQSLAHHLHQQQQSHPHAAAAGADADWPSV